MTTPLGRSLAFCKRFNLRAPILLAPMAGACPPAVSIEVIRAGGAGACGALLMTPEQIHTWVTDVGVGPFQINLWTPDPPPVRDVIQEANLRKFLAEHGPEVAVEAGDSTPPSFDAQCEAVLAAKPAIASSIMGVFPPAFVGRLKAMNIAWLANVTTVAEAKAAEAAGADLIVAQGMEAGGHRGAFDAARAEHDLVGLFALLPAVVDAVKVPVIAAGGIADGRGVAAALMLGASAVSIGTAFLRCPESALPSAWADALAHTTPEKTTVTRAFSGRPGRSVETSYIRAARSAPTQPAPYPVQRGLTAAMRSQATKNNDLDHMQAWAGQSAALARKEPASAVVERLWTETRALLSAT